jgi:hypothetical protein
MEDPNFASPFISTREYSLPQNASGCPYPACGAAFCKDKTSPSADWHCLWGKYYSELILVRLDDGQIHRLAHHRSRIDRYDFAGFYYSTTRAAISRDGRFVAFDSNFGQTLPGVVRYNDVYTLSTMAPQSPPPCGPCVVSFCQGEGGRCTFNDTCGAGGCCHYTCGPDPTCTAADPVPPGACSPL